MLQHRSEGAPVRPHYLITGVLLSLTFLAEAQSNITDANTVKTFRTNTISSAVPALGLENTLYIGLNIEGFIYTKQSSVSRQRMECGDWPESFTLLELKSLLGDELYCNIAVDCPVHIAREILTSLTFKKYNASQLDLPRVNVIVFDDLSGQLRRELYDPTNLINIIFNIIPDRFPRNCTSPLPREECCIQSTVTAVNTRTSMSSAVVGISESCVLTNRSRFTLRPTEALSGLHFTITFDAYFPFIKAKEVNGIHILDGYCYEVLRLLSQHLNFTYTAIPSIDDKYGSRNPKTGEWNGMVGMIVRKQADMVFTGLTITKERSEAVDFSYPFFVEPSNVVFRIWDHKEAYFYKPLRWKVWLAILGCVSVGVVIALCLEVVSAKIKDKPLVYSYSQSLSTISIVIFATSLLKSEDRLMSGRAARLFWVSFWLVSLVIVTTYSGNLVAALATQHVKLPFTTIDELAENKEYRITMSVGGAHQTLLQEAKGGAFAELWKRVELVPSSTKARLRMLNSSEPWAHLGDQTSSEQHLRRIGSCEWRSLPEEFFPSGLGIAMPKGSPYNKLISQDMIAMAQHGLFDLWERKHFLKSQCEGGKRYNSGSILFSHIWLLMIVTGGCLAVCVLILGLELMMAPLKRQAVTER